MLQVRLVQEGSPGSWLDLRAPYSVWDEGTPIEVFSHFCNSVCFARILNNLTTVVFDRLGVRSNFTFATVKTIFYTMELLVK